MTPQTHDACTIGNNPILLERIAAMLRAYLILFFVRCSLLCFCWLWSIQIRWVGVGLTALLSSATLLEMMLSFPQGKAIYHPITQVKYNVLPDDRVEMKHKINEADHVYYRNLVFPIFWPAIRHDDIFLLAQWTRIYFALTESWLYF